ncbi:pyrimidodiazepine synthase-like [Zophobas morio]|uniref:pyrimidodiazepine synthase-like n=1 Tax=Zophobas morio TaxID=2755281 RepID=UPI0030832DDB
MSTAHLGPGSQQPPKVDGKLRLYSMEFCPYAQRARLVLAAKNLPHDIVNINLKTKPEWYFKVHPEGKVPALDTGSEVIIESLVISDYLDEKYPNPILYPKDPAAKKEDQELIKKIESLTSVFYKLLLGKEDQSPEEWAKAFVAELDVFEKVLASRGTKFLGGDKPGMVDYMLWPWSERKGVLSLKLGQKLPIGEGQLTLVRKWHEDMLQDAAVKATYNDLEKHWKLTQSRLNNTSVDYDKI